MVLCLHFIALDCVQVCSLYVTSTLGWKYQFIEFACFVFSYSWGYKRVFEQYATALHEKFPQLAIEGDNYPPPMLRQYLAQGLSILKLALIVMVIIGQDPFPHLNMETPSIFQWAVQNKVSLKADNTDSISHKILSLTCPAY